MKQISNRIRAKNWTRQDNTLPTQKTETDWGEIKSVRPIY